MKEQFCENDHEMKAFIPLERSATSAIGTACGVEGQTSDTMKPHLIQVKILLHRNCIKVQLTLKIRHPLILDSNFHSWKKQCQRNRFLA